MKRDQQGFVLAVSLIFLLIMTTLGVSMFNGFTQDQKMAANFREKSRAVDAAQAGLNSVEFWLSQGNNTYLGAGNWVLGTTCSVNGDITPSSPVVCDSPLTAPANLPWSSYTSYTPAGMTIASSGENKYYSRTNVHTYFMGVTGTNPPVALYQVTSAAKGGNDAATAVLRTVYKVKANSVDLGGG